MRERERERERESERDRKADKQIWAEKESEKVKQTYRQIDRRERQLHIQTKDLHRERQTDRIGMNYKKKDKSSYKTESPNISILFDKQKRKKPRSCSTLSVNALIVDS